MSRNTESVRCTSLALWEGTDSRNNTRHLCGRCFAAWAARVRVADVVEHRGESVCEGVRAEAREMEGAAA